MFCNIYKYIVEKEKERESIYLCKYIVYAPVGHLKKLKTYIHLKTNKLDFNNVIRKITILLFCAQLHNFLTLTF